MITVLPTSRAQTALDHLYGQIAQRITRLIEEGTLRPGDRIPSVRKFCTQQEVSVATVMQAYRLLESRGLIEARPQSGYYVRARRWPLPPEPEMAKPERRSSKVEVSELVMEVIKPGFSAFGRHPSQPGVISNPRTEPHHGRGRPSLPRSGE